MDKKDTKEKARDESRPTWQLHSPTTPRCRTILMAADRSMWYASSDSVCEGATTIESPVWIPRGSKFSYHPMSKAIGKPEKRATYHVAHSDAYE